MSLTWTTRRPTVAGFYFFRISEKRYVFEVFEYDGNSRFRVDARSLNGSWAWISDYVFDKGEWAGPIPEPGEEEKQ